MTSSTPYLLSSQTLKRIEVASIFLFVFVMLPSFPKVRNILAVPLVVHEQSAHGDACYVLAGGEALWERLDAVADLVQMGRVTSILLMRDDMRG